MSGLYILSEEVHVDLHMFEFLGQPIYWFRCVAKRNRGVGEQRGDMFICIVFGRFGYQARAYRDAYALQHLSEEQ